MANPASRPLKVIFFQTKTGKEPAREWIKSLPLEDKKSIGADIESLQWLWPVGKPLVDHMGKGLWEIRCKLDQRIARVFFIMVNEKIILLHGIIKKSQTTPKQDLDLARKRQAIYLENQNNS